MKKLLLILLLLAIPAYATITTTTTRVSYATDGAATAFTFSFPIPGNETSDIIVLKRTTATGAETVMTETTDYSLSAPNNDYSSGGTVTTVDTLAAGFTLVIFRDVPDTQNAVLADTKVLRLAGLEGAYDRLTMEVQQLQEQLNRSPHSPRSDATTISMEFPNSIDRADKTLTFDSDGAVTATAAAETTVAFSGFGQTLVSRANAAAAMVTLSGMHVENIETYGASTGAAGSVNAAAIQAAIDAAESVGGVAYFPPGIYEVDTQITADGAIVIWGPGATIKQEAAADVTAVLKIDVATDIDVTVYIKVDGNMDNNAAVEGIVLQGLKHSAGWINVFAEKCDTGIVVEGDTEANVLFLKATDCTIGVLERINGAGTPDENILFISGHTNATHYKKESADINITSTLHFACETSSSTAVIIDSSGTGSAETTMSGILRGCADSGVVVTGADSENTDNTRVYFNNLSVLQSSGVDNGWGVIINRADFVRGAVYINQFDGGFWIKRCRGGSLLIDVNGSASLPGIRLGDTGNSTANRFTVTHGSSASATTGPTLHLSQTSFCDVDLQFLAASSGDHIEFETTAANDTIRLIGDQRFTTAIEDNSTADYTVIYYGGPQEEDVYWENGLIAYENSEIKYIEQSL